MVVISNEVSQIFKILAMEVNTEQELFSVLVPRDLLLRVDVEQQLGLLIETLKEKYKSSKLNCLHKNRDDKQKFPGINLVRQILRCNGYHLKPVIYSRGYCKHSGKKIVDRNFKVIRLENYSEIKLEEENYNNPKPKTNTNTQQNYEQSPSLSEDFFQIPTKQEIDAQEIMTISTNNLSPSNIKEIELNF